MGNLLSQIQASGPVLAHQAISPSVDQTSSSWVNSVSNLETQGLASLAREISVCQIRMLFLFNRFSILFSMLTGTEQPRPIYQRR